MVLKADVAFVVLTAAVVQQLKRQGPLLGAELAVLQHLGPLGSPQVVLHDVLVVLAVYDRAFVNHDLGLVPLAEGILVLRNGGDHVVERRRLAVAVDTQLRYPDYIEAKDLEEAVEKAGLTVEKGDIFLMYTGHYNRTYAKGDIEGYQNYYTGLSYEAAEWLAKKGVVNIGVDSSAIDQTPDDLDFSGHLVCGKYGMTNTENLRNLDLVAGKRFFYMGLPLRIRDGSGSPVRAVALVEK